MGVKPNDVNTQPKSPDFTRLSPYPSSPGSSYAEVTISSRAVLLTIASTRCANLLSLARLSWPVWLGYAISVLTQFGVIDVTAIVFWQLCGFCSGDRVNRSTSTDGLTSSSSDHVNVEPASVSHTPDVSVSSTAAHHNMPASKPVCFGCHFTFCLFICKSSALWLVTINCNCCVNVSVCNVLVCSMVLPTVVFLFVYIFCLFFSLLTNMYNNCTFHYFLSLLCADWSLVMFWRHWCYTIYRVWQICTKFDNFWHAESQDDR